jgi:two-component system phosphate regulon sensor histidine kinase PhoR
VTATSTQGELLRELLDSSRDGILALDENGVVVYANTAAATLLERSKLQVIGKPFAVFLPLERRRAFRRALTMLEPGASASVDLRNTQEEKESIAVIRRTEQRSPPRFAVRLAVPSGTEHARPAEAAPPTRRAISRELDGFFLRFPRAVLGIDRTLKVVFANPRARNILGRDLIRIGRPFVDGPAEGRLRALAERLTTIAAPVPASLVELRDGRRLRVTGVAASGREPAVMLLEDVTEEVRHDEVTRDFLRNAAHQLRTPLTGIATAVQVLQSGAKDDAEDRDRFLAHIERHTARLSRIARGLLVLARAQSGETVRVEFVELEPLLRELTSEARPAEGVTLHVVCEPGISALSDRDLLHEAVAALIDNAVEHTHAGRIDVTAAEADGRVTVEVRDTGPGILPEHRERLFEPFYRPSASGHGFGLGLAIAAQAIEAMHGDLAVDGNDPGTRFTIRLPSARVIA